MLDYFVKIFPEEAPYSYLMRLKENLGFDDKDFASLILNKGKISQQIILGQIDLEHFTNTFKALKNKNFDEWTNDHTLLSYCKNLSNHDYFDWDIKNNTKYTRKSNYLVQNKGKPIIKFCKDCYLENYKRFNNYFLLKKHQLPGCYICLKHEKPLHYVDVSKTSSSIYALQISNILQNPSLNQFQLENLNFFKQLAFNSQLLFENPISRERIRDYYLELYYREGTRIADFKSLSFNLRAYFGNFLDEIALLNGNLDFSEKGLIKEFVPYKNIYNPIICLMIFQLNKVYYENDIILPDFKKSLIPKKDSCINKICQHYKKNKACLLKENTSRLKITTAYYKCEDCQMTYSKSYDQDNDNPTPTIINYGPPFILKLESLIKNNMSLKKMSDILGVLENHLLKIIQLSDLETPEIKEYVEKNTRLITYRDEFEHLIESKEGFEHLIKHAQNLEEDPRLLTKPIYRRLNHIRKFDPEFFEDIIYTPKEKYKNQYVMVDTHLLSRGELNI